MKPIVTKEGIKLRDEARELMLKKASIEKTLPSLKKKIIGMWATSLSFPDDGRREAELRTNSELLCKRLKEEKRTYRNDFVLLEDVQKYTVDKQKLRELIKRKLQDCEPDYYAGEFESKMSDYATEKILELKESLDLEEE